MTKFTLRISIPLFLLLTGCAAHNETRDSNTAETEKPAVSAIKKLATGSIYNDSTSIFLFSDIKARRVGDLLTVILRESTNASKSASTSTSRAAKIDVPDPTVLGGLVTRNGQPILSMDVDTGTDFSGKGDSSQSNSLTGNIAVLVTEILDNGYLHVKGEKTLSLNQGTEVVIISGIVRPNDISPQNTILSTQIAGAEITYSGKGAIAGSNRQGWLTRFFNSGWWPF